MSRHQTTGYERDPLPQTPIHRGLNRRPDYRRRNRVIATAISISAATSLTAGILVGKHNASRNNPLDDPGIVCTGNKHTTLGDEKVVTIEEMVRQGTIPGAELNIQQAIKIILDRNPQLKPTEISPVRVINIPKSCKELG
jgi:hypothetical protein